MSLKTRFIGVSLSAVVALATPITVYYEGKELRAYLDPVGIPTICSGETENVRLGDTHTSEDCDNILNARLTYIAWRIEMMTGPLPPETHAALSSFAYNVGLGAFRQSTLFRKLNQGDVAGACNQLPRWVYAGGKKFTGLVRRREAERKLCLKGIGQ